MNRTLSLLAAALISATLHGEVHVVQQKGLTLSLIHISEPTRPY